MIGRFISLQGVIAAGSVIGVLGIGGAFTKIGPWYENLRKPSWQPPGWLFGPVWTTIGVLTAISGLQAWHGVSEQRAGTLITLFAINGGLNIAWSVLFFTAQRPDWALVEVVPLWLSVAALVVCTASCSTTAPWLLMPYLIWVGIAAFLNLAIVRLNGPFEQVATQA